jgi:hypothetical protein
VSPKRRPLTDAQIDKQGVAGREREAKQRAAGLRAHAARYDRRTKRVVLELTNGAAFAFPISIVRGLEHATAAQRSALSLTPSGSAVEWQKFEADISVPGVLRLAADGKLTDPPTFGERLIGSLREAIAYERGERVAAMVRRVDRSSGEELLEREGKRRGKR